MTDDVEAARAWGRRELMGYVIVPAYRRAFERQGFADVCTTAMQAWDAGDRKAAREKAEEERRRERQAREAAAKAAVYAQRLDELATRQEEAWKRADTLIETKNPRDYDTAVTLLSDLRVASETATFGSSTARFGAATGNTRMPDSFATERTSVALPPPSGPASACASCAVSKIDSSVSRSTLTAQSA